MYTDEILIAAEMAAELRRSRAAGSEWSDRCPLPRSFGSGWIVARDSMGLKSDAGRGEACLSTEYDRSSARIYPIRPLPRETQERSETVAEHSGHRM